MTSYTPVLEAPGDEDDMVTDTPRVCLLTETFYPVVGGGETHARLISRHLNSMGMNTFVLTRRSGKQLTYYEVIDGVTTLRVPPTGMKRFGKYAMLPFVLRELLHRKDDYDLILVCGFRVLGALAIAAARMAGKTCVLRAESRGEMSGGYASAYERLSASTNFLFRRWIAFRNCILKKADAYISISTPITQELAYCGVKREKIFDIPNGIDTETYRTVDVETKRVLRKRLQLPSDDFIASYSGKLNKGKGLDSLIEAWKTIATRNRDAHLVLVGSGGGQSLSCENELRRRVGELGLIDRVTFTGYVENVHEYLQASDMFVFPSENESFGLSLVEAMACGLPSIACGIDSIREIITHGENGLLVNPRDHHGLAQAISTIMDNSEICGSMGEKACELVNERYSIKAISEKYYELFSSLCSYSL